MLLDLQNLLCDNQVLGNVGTIVSTNTIDLGAAGTVPAGFQARGTPQHDIGLSGPRRPHMLVQITETAVGATATAQFQLITSANADLSSPVVLASSAVIAVGTLVAGYRPRLDLVHGIVSRYLGIQWIVGTANFTAGKVKAGLVIDLQNTFIG